MDQKYTLQQISDKFGVHIETVRRWVRSGKLKAHKEVGRGKLLVVELSDLDGFRKSIEE